MKHYLLSAAALAAISFSANTVFAEPPAQDGPKAMEGKMDHDKMGGPGGMEGHKMGGQGGMMGGKGNWEPPKSRQEAISKTKEHLAKLEKMSDDEWKTMHDNRMERREKWKEASPEEREKMKENFKDRREKKELPGESQ